MALVAIRKARKPRWQDVRPDDPELVEAHTIAVKYERKFAKAFKKLVKRIRSKITIKDLLADPFMDIETLISKIPWYDETSPTSADSRIWLAFANELQDLYKSIARDSGNKTLERNKIPFQFEKAKKGPIKEVPANPRVLQWSEAQTGKLVADISKSTRKTIQRIVTNGIENGITPREMAKQIENSIGLLGRQEAAAQRQYQQQLKAGIPKRQANKNLQEYRKKLLEQRANSIARTETLKAESAGVNEAWQYAKEQGYIGENAGRRWVALDESELTCPICGDLHWKIAKLGEPFDSIEGPIDHPPAHPSCRCIEILETNI